MLDTYPITHTPAPDIARLMQAQIAAKIYESEDDIIRQALRRWADREAKLAALDAAIDRGIADADAGRVKDVETVRKELLAVFE